MSKYKGNTRNSSEGQLNLSEYKDFTKDKLPQFAVYYNLAHTRLNQFLFQLTGVKDLLNQKSLELPKESWLKLTEYLWKGISNFEKNSSGTYYSKEEAEVADKMLKKFVEIRNFQSHIWHDCKVLVFDDDLRKFVEEKYEIALKETSRLSGVSSSLFYEQRETRKFYKLFTKVKGSYYITLEGRLFFLSFFLNKGDMEALLQQSKGSKGNFLPEHRFKRKAYTFYCHREGAAVNSPLAVLEGELQNTDQEIHNYKMAHKVLTYLRDQPPYYMNPEYMPLWIRKNDEEVEIDSIEDLLQFISEKKLFSKLRLKKKEFSSGIDVVKGKKSKGSNSGKKKSKELADNKRIGVIEMTLKGEENYILKSIFPRYIRFAWSVLYMLVKPNIFIKYWKA